MKAIVYHEYGTSDVLRLEEVEKPVPKDKELLIKVRAASVNPLDWRFMNGKPAFLRVFLGLRKPKNGRPGVDLAGEVESVGEKVTKYKPGDVIFGGCTGALAEYAVTTEKKIAIKPADITYEQAGSVNVAGLTALQGLRDKGKVQRGSKVLINGASGGVGTFAVQLAKWLGAHVTGVCSAKNIDLVRSMGADEVIDYTQKDFTKVDELYDVIVECVGNHGFSECRRVLNPNGKFVGVGAPHELSMLAILGGLIRDISLSAFGSRKSVLFVAKPSSDDLKLIGELIASGKVKPVIEKVYPLSEGREAMRHIEEGHARGKVVVVP